MDDRGNSGKSLEGVNGSLSHDISLAFDVSPVNDPPILVMPTSLSSEIPLFTEEDRIGTVGADCCGWSDENTLRHTIISNSSIALLDADISYNHADGSTTPQQSYSRWILAQDKINENTVPTIDDTVTINISVAWGGVLLSNVRSEVSITGISGEEENAEGKFIPSGFYSSMTVIGPLWAVGEALKGMRYQSSLNWNSWAGLGMSELDRVALEVSWLFVASARVGRAQPRTPGCSCVSCGSILGIEVGARCQRFFRGNLAASHDFLHPTFRIRYLTYFPPPVAQHVSFWMQEITLRVIDSDGGTSNALLAFVVMPENDPPVLESSASTYNSSMLTHDGLSHVVLAVDVLITREDQSSLVPGLSVRDVDLTLGKGPTFGGGPEAMDGGIIEVTVYASNGTVSVGTGSAGYVFLVGDGMDDRLVAFRTTLAGANQALAGLMYTGLNDFYGTDDLVVTVDDLGNYGRGSLCPDGEADGWRRYSDTSLCHQVMDC